MNLSQLFDSWRQVTKANNNWGLTWFLAYQFCRRYYASHGIVPHVIDHEGLGYYGIRLDQVSCGVHGEGEVHLGRMTMFGNVENWRRGGPGDHGLQLIDQCDQGVPTDSLVQQAVRHMDLPILPEKSHIQCRHKRWGQSYEVLFGIATILALRNEMEIILANSAYHIGRDLEAEDPKAGMKEHMGGFLFRYEDRSMLISGDGRIVRPQKPDNLWQRYMQGESVWMLAMEVEGFKRIAPERAG